MPTAINRKIFFDHLRGQPMFKAGLQSTAVHGIEAILNEWEKRKLTDLRWLAYMLATTLGECGRNMLPVREGFKKTDAESRAYVKSKNYKYAVEKNGHIYYGRGNVQLTWETNYVTMGSILGLDLVHNPDLVLRPDIAAAVMFEGMIRGSFTGKKLSHYFGPGVSDWDNARRIINGTDRMHEIGSYGKQFYASLLVATAFDAPSEPAPTPTPEKPPTKHWLAVIVDAILNLFRKK
jgi:putative chitinase